MALILSDSARAYVQSKTGIGNIGLVVTNDELDYIYDYETGDINATIASVWETIAADQAKLVNYSNGLQSEDLSDLLDHCLKMADRYWGFVNHGNQFKNVGLRPTPIKHKEKPWTENRYDRSLRRKGTDWDWS